MSLIVLISAFYVYIHRIYTYITGFIMKRKKIPITQSRRNLNDIEKGEKREKAENDNLVKSDIHYHFYYLNVDERTKKLDDFKLNCHYCDNKINDDQVCYVVFDSWFCSVHCQRMWVSHKKTKV